MVDWLACPRAKKLVREVLRAVGTARGAVTLTQFRLVRDLT